MFVVPALPTDEEGRPARRRGPPRSPRSSASARACGIASSLGISRTFAGRGTRRGRAAFCDGVVRLVGGVERSREEVLRQAVAPRGDQGGEVRRASRPLVRMPPAPGGRPARSAEPADDVRLDLRQARRGGEHADVAVDGVGDQVRDRGVGQSRRPGCRRGIPGPAVLKLFGIDASKRRSSSSSAGRPVFRHGLGERARERGAALGVGRRLRGQRARCAPRSARSAASISSAQGAPGRARGSGLRSSRRSLEVRDPVFAPGPTGIHGGSGISRSGESAKTLGFVHLPQLRQTRRRLGHRGQGNLRFRQRLAQPRRDRPAAAGPDSERPRSRSSTSTMSATAWRAIANVRRAWRRHCVSTTAMQQRARVEHGRHRGDPRLVVVLRAVEREHRERDVALEQLGRPLAPTRGAARPERRRRSSPCGAAGSRGRVGGEPARASSSEIAASRREKACDSTGRYPMTSARKPRPIPDSNTVKSGPSRDVRHHVAEAEGEERRAAHVESGRGSCRCRRATPCASPRPTA